ncbi:MAG: hypothetical protein ACNYPE_15905 [Candidatus Azotimanducaceae bacterium WSBS_2022_MAG_OTU7]
MEQHSMEHLGIFYLAGSIRRWRPKASVSPGTRYTLGCHPAGMIETRYRIMEEVFK